MARRVPHEVTLVAYRQSANGKTVITDIIETSNHFAPRWVRAFMRVNIYEDSTHFAAYPPKAPFTGRQLHQLPR